MVKKGLINEKYAMDAQFVKLYAKLEMWYPEHKVYLMDAIDKHLREDFSKYAKDHGKNTEELLKEIGFESISGDDVYALRGPAKYSPGKEPEIIKSKVERVLIKLKDAYPDRIITKSLQNDHKRLSSEILGISKWLGYKNSEEFLKTYGFECQYLQKGGRPTTDTDDVIEELKKRYPDGPAFSKQGDLFNANPDLAGKLKTLANNAKQLYGVSSKEYLCQQGLLSSGKSQASQGKTQDSIDKKTQKYTTKPIKLPEIDINPKIKTDIEWSKTGGYWIRSAYGRAVFRGLKSQIDEAVDFIYKTVTPKYDIYDGFMKISNTEIPDIYEICIMNTIDQDETHDIVGQVLAKFPCLKMVSFYEETRGEGSVVYSAPGYNYVTDIKFVGYYDHKSDFPFVWDKNPTQDFKESFVFVQTGDRGKINYRFPFRKKWNEFNYLINTKDGFSAVIINS